MIDLLLNIRNVLLVVLALCFGGATFAQEVEPGGQPAKELIATWDATVAKAQDLLESGTASTETLDNVRFDLAEQRSAAQALIEEATATVDDIRSQIDALGPAPEEGATEPDEIAQRRTELAAELQTAQVPLLDAQSSRERIDRTLKAIDTQVRTRLSTELIELGPSPLLPENVTGGVRDTINYFDTIRTEVEETLDNEFTRGRVMQRLPVATILCVFGLLVLFGMGARQVLWFQKLLARSDIDPNSAWVGAATNLGRLIVPIVAASTLITGIKTLGIFGPAGDALVAGLPGLAGSIILAYWIGHSLFAPVLAQFRLVDVDDVTAGRCTRLTLILGFVAGLYLLLNAIVQQQQSSASTIAALTFPLIVVGAISLWRLAALVRPVLAKPVADTTEDDAPVPAEPFGLSFLRFFRRATVVIACLTPLLAAIGYGRASKFLLFSTIQTLAVLGGSFVVYMIMTRTLEGFLKRQAGDDPAAAKSSGLWPVLFGFVIACFSLPNLALIWGARRSDLLEVWVWMRDGVNIGGSRVSLSDFIIFLVIFGLGYALTRFLQSLMRGTVLPRTKLDIGGQNAVTTGIGYIGIVLAGLLAITSTGLDLSSLAIVAGALSLGIGFGLQTIVSNFVSGIILLVERPIKQGDWIEVAGFSGYVRDISVRSTSIETFDKATVIVPNQELIAGSVLNWTHGSMSGRVIVPVGVAYGTDPKRVQEILLDIANSHPLVLRRPAPAVLFIGFGADSLDFEIRAHLRDVNYMMSARSDMNFEISKRFAEGEIEIPFAQRDINLRNPEEIANLLRALPKES